MAASTTCRVHHAVAPASSGAPYHQRCIISPSNTASYARHSCGSYPAIKSMYSAQAGVPFDQIRRSKSLSPCPPRGGCEFPACGGNRSGLFKRWFSWGRPTACRQQEGMQLARALLDQYAAKSQRQPCYARQQSFHPPCQPHPLRVTPAGNGGGKNSQLLHTGDFSSQAHLCPATQTHTKDNPPCLLHQGPAKEINKQTHHPAIPCTSSHPGHHRPLHRPANNIPVAPSTSPPLQPTRPVCCWRGGSCNAQRLEASQKTPSAWQPPQASAAGHRCAGRPAALAAHYCSCCSHGGRAGEGGGCRSEATAECPQKNVKSCEFVQQAAAPERHTLARHELWRHRGESISSFDAAALPPANRSQYQRGAASCCSTMTCVHRTAAANEETNKRQRVSYPPCACGPEAPSFRPPLLQQHGRFASSTEAVHPSACAAAAQPSRTGMAHVTAGGCEWALDRTRPQNTGGAEGRAVSFSEQQQQHQLELLWLQHELLAERQARQEQQLLQQKQELRRQRRQVERNRQAVEAEAEKRALEVDGGVDCDGESEDAGEWLSLNETDVEQSKTATLHQSTDVSCGDCCSETEQADCCGSYSDSPAESDSQEDETSSDEVEKRSNSRTGRKLSRSRLKWFRALKTPPRYRKGRQTPIVHYQMRL